MSSRTYGQYCALARTLDIVGDRWTLLVIRELIGGPKRYSDLHAALPGIGTSLLARRLQTLEAHDIVQRSVLPPPAASTVYELTDVGRELRDALLPLVGWGARHLLGPRRRGELFRTEWPLLAVATAIDPARFADVDDVYEFRVDGSVAHLRLDHGVATARPGPATDADVVLTTDVVTFVDVGVGRLDPALAITEGRLRLEGSADAIARCARLMRSVTAG